MKVLVVDDEPLARQRLNRLLSQIPGYNVVAEAENGEQALAKVSQCSPDIVLMDIRMPVMDGLQAAQQLALTNEPPAVIFCTAYGDYALQAFDANAVGYLLKPVNREKLAQALHKAQMVNKSQLVALQQSASAAVTPNEPAAVLTVSSSRGVELIPLVDVRYFHADHKYVTVVYQKQQRFAEVLTDLTLKQLEENYAARFVRVHRNALVALAHIQGFERRGADVRVCIAGVEEGPLISRRHLPALRKLLNPST